jgi:hypothetical protein
MAGGPIHRQTQDYRDAKQLILNYITGPLFPEYYLFLLLSGRVLRDMGGARAPISENVCSIGSEKHQL